MNGIETAHQSDITAAPRPGPLRSRTLRLLLPLFLVGLPILLVGLPIWSGMKSAQLTRNETHAISLLRNLHTWIAQHMGAANVEADVEVAVPSFQKLAAIHAAIAEHLENHEGREILEIDGYLFELHIHPAVADGKPRYTCYAWPIDLGSTGNRTYLITELGDVLASQNRRARYEGYDQTPHAFAGFLRAAEGDPSRALYAANTIGRDGEAWVVV